MKKIIVFDLHGTLTEGKQRIDGELIYLLDGLLDDYDVGITSGFPMKQLDIQVASALKWDLRKRLCLLPLMGAEMYLWDDSWVKICDEKLSKTEKRRVLTAFEWVKQFSNETVYGKTIEDRGSQITYAVLGLDAPLEEKCKWDKDCSKRRLLKDKLQEKLPDFEIIIGGHTSISVTHKNVNKTMAIKRIQELLGYKDTEILYIGNAFKNNGDDYCVKAMGIDCVEVSCPEETKEAVRKLLSEGSICNIR